MITKRNKSNCKDTQDIDKLKEMKIDTKILSDLLYFFDEKSVHRLEIPIQNIIF